MFEALVGASVLASAAIAVFFLRFWQQSRDGLFLRFAFAFWALALSYALLGVVAFATEWRVYVFMVRLAAFCLILYAIFEKNRR
jgi:hypothetical protein